VRHSDAADALGNIGIAGGGVNALRARVTSRLLRYGLLFHLLPGYLKSPELTTST